MADSLRQDGDQSGGCLYCRDALAVTSCDLCGGGYCRAHIVTVRLPRVGERGDDGDTVTRGWHVCGECGIEVVTEVGEYVRQLALRQQRP